MTKYPVDLFPTPELSETERSWIDDESQGKASLHNLIMEREALIDFIASHGGSYGANSDVVATLDETTEKINQAKQQSGP